jgi:hypothetical protein
VSLSESLNTRDQFGVGNSHSSEVDRLTRGLSQRSCLMTPTGTQPISGQGGGSLEVRRTNFQPACLVLLGDLGQIS